MSNKMNICLACNDLYFDLLVVAIHSVQKHNQYLNFFIYLNSDEKYHFEKVFEIISSNNNEVHFFSIEEVAEILPIFLSQKDYISVETYFRLLIPQLISEDKILYLDVDLIVRGSLLELYNTDIERCYFAAVAYDRSLIWLKERNTKLGLKDDHPYYMAGTLLLNLKKIRQDTLFHNTLKLIEYNPELSDQDALNIITKENYFMLDLKYSWTMHDVQSGINPIIVHFAGPYKPNIKYYIHPYSAEFKFLYKQVFPDRLFIINYRYMSNALIKALIKELLRVVRFKIIKF